MRRLTVAELMFVAGGDYGDGGADGGEIVVTAPQGGDSGGDGGDYGGSDSGGDYGEGDGGSGGGSPAVGDSGANEQAAKCPPGHQCVPVPNSNGMFVRDTSDNKLYFSDQGAARYQHGASIDWAGVAKDLAVIATGAAGGMGPSAINVVGAVAGAVVVVLGTGHGH